MEWFKLHRAVACDDDHWAKVKILSRNWILEYKGKYRNNHLEQIIIIIVNFKEAAKA